LAPAHVGSDRKRSCGGSGVGVGSGEWVSGAPKPVSAPKATRKPTLTAKFSARYNWQYTDTALVRALQCVWPMGRGGCGPWGGGDAPCCFDMLKSGLRGGVWLGKLGVVVRITRTHEPFGQRKRPNLVSGEWRSLLSCTFTFPAASQTRQFDQTVVLEGLPPIKMCLACTMVWLRTRARSAS
jgi:hypothetical protein